MELVIKEKLYPQRKTQKQTALLVILPNFQRKININSSQTLSKSRTGKKQNKTKQKNRKGGNTSQHFLSGQYFPDLKLDKNITRKPQTITHMNTNSKVLNKILAKQIKHHKKVLVVMYKFVS